MSAIAFPIRFAGDLPAWLVMLMAVGAVVVVLWLYQRETKSLAAPYNVLLPSLRAAAIAMVVLILAGPVWHRRQIVGTLGRVLFAVDTSQSMSLTDSSAQDQDNHRLRRATRLLFGDDGSQGWLQEISKTHLVDVVAFDAGRPTTIWSSSADAEGSPVGVDWSPSGAATDLTLPLESVLQSLDLGTTDLASEGRASDQDSLRRSAVVLMTDGRDTFAARNLGRSATAAAEELSGAGTVVHTLGIGSVQEPADVGISEVIHPETVALDSQLAGEVIIGRYGRGNESITVRIESDGEVVWQNSFSMGNTGIRKVPFEIDVRSLIETIRSRSPRGIERANEVLRLVAKVETTGADFTSVNNRMNFRVAASTRNRRLLLMDGSSRWETRYIKNLFERDPAWQVDLVLFGPATENKTLVRGNDPGTFPNSDEAMAAYDAVVLGEIDATQLTSEDTARIKRFVAEGGGLIVIDGRFRKLASLVAGEFAELLPVRYRGRRQKNLPLEISPTDVGLTQPALALIDRSDRLKSFWEQLPSPKWAAPVEIVEGAESWADVNWGNGNSVPWLATRVYGSGRVFYFSSDQSWRWRYKVADRFHVRFWNQILVAAIEPPYSASDQFVSLGTDQVDYLPGDPVEVRARLKDTRGNPVGDATVDAVVMKDNTEFAVVPLAPRNPKRGTYEGSIDSLPAGEYAIRIRASGYDESALMATTPIWIGEENSGEMLRLSLDPSALRQIAAAGDGRYLHESEAEELLPLLKPLSSGTIVESDTILWQSYFWFIPIIALLATEWYLRKRAGLV